MGEDTKGLPITAVDLYHQLGEVSVQMGIIMQQIGRNTEILDRHSGVLIRVEEQVKTTNGRVTELEIQNRIKAAVNGPWIKFLWLAGGVLASGAIGLAVKLIAG